jgi:hypothetical protein
MLILTTGGRQVGSERFLILGRFNNRRMQALQPARQRREMQTIAISGKP